MFATLLFLVVTFTSSFLPGVAHAGLLSLVGDLFKKSPVLADSRSVNTQNMPLLQPAVHLDPNPAKGGGDIVTVEGTALLPDSGPSGSSADIEGGHLSGRISVYVVRSGDTLADIAKLFGVSINTVRWANDMSNGKVVPGQTLVILPVSGVKHVVSAGDTVMKLAKKYKADAGEIRQFNDIEGDVLAVGETVIIPDGEILLPPPTAQKPTSRLHGTSGPSYEGYYLRPIVGGRKTQGLHGYNGVDLASFSGAPILASASGQVIVAKDYGWNGGYGKYIVITHDNGTQTLYGHLSSLIVSSGQSVVKGQVIGGMGSTGKSTGVHLHFEVRGAKNPF